MAVLFYFMDFFVNIDIITIACGKVTAAMKAKNKL
jgi:hypothetical protein